MLVTIILLVGVGLGVFAGYHIGTSPGTDFLSRAKNYFLLFRN